MTSSRRFDRLLQAGCLGLIGMLAAAGCGGSSSKATSDAGSGKLPDVGPTTDTAPAVLVSVSPLILDFGTVDVGKTSSKPATVTVTNKGPATSLTPEVTGSAFQLAASTCDALPAGGTCTISVSFTPTATGSAQGTLIVAGSIKVSLTGVGSPAGNFTITDSVDLGTVLVGASVAGKITVVATNALTDLLCSVSSGGNIKADATTTTCTTALPAGGTCNVGFTFSSTTPGVKSSDQIVCNAAQLTKIASIRATVASPAKLLITPTTASIPATTGKSSELTFYVANSGDVKTGPLSATIPATSPEFTVSGSTCGVGLLPLANCTVTVLYKPTADGTKTATLTVAEAGTGGASISAVITGVATGPSNLSISGGPDLGTVAVGSAGAPVTFTIKNTGGTDAAGITVVTSLPTQFVIGNDTCTGKTLARTTGSCTIDVTFTPGATSTLGVNTALLTANSADNTPFNLSITGTAIKPATLTIAPNPLAFEGIALNTQSGDKILTVTNTGAASTGALTVPSALGNGFVISANGCSAELLPTTSCTIAIRFTPGTITTATWTLTVTSASGASADAALTGTGRQPNVLEISPRDVVACPTTGESEPGDACFADTALGQTDGSFPRTPGQTPVTFTITNTNVASAGGINLESGPVTVTIGGTNPGDFVKASTNCGPSLAPGQTCLYTVSFKPTAPGVRTATISVTSTNGGNTATNMTANGLPAIEIQPCGYSASAGNNPVSLGVSAKADCVDALKNGALNTRDRTGLAFGQVSLGANCNPLNVKWFLVTINSSTAADFRNLITASLTDPATPSNFRIANVGNVDQCNNTNVDVGAGPAQCWISVQFMPQGTATDAKTATVGASGGSGGSASLNLTGTATGPLTINPSPQEFGTVVVNEAESTSLTLTVSNWSTTNALGPVTAAVTGDAAGDFRVVYDTCTNTTLAAQSGTTCSTSGASSCQIGYRFYPAAAGDRKATLTVTAGTQTSTAVLHGTAVPETTIAATPLAVDFGHVVLSNKSDWKTVTITAGAGATETGTLMFGIEDVTKSGQFERGTGVNAGTCGETDTIRLGGGNPTSCTIKVRYAPTAHLGLGAAKAVLTVRDPRDFTLTQKVVLTGIGDSQLVISPTTGDFGLMAVGQAVTTKLTFTVTNRGTAAIASPSLTVTAPFVSTGTEGGCPSGTGSIAGNNATCLVVVNYSGTPSAAGLINANPGVQITGGSANDSTATAQLSGTVQTNASLKLVGQATSPVIDMGGTATGSTGGRVLLLYRNEGGHDTSIVNYYFRRGGDRIAINSPDADFAVVPKSSESDIDNCLGNVIKGGTYCKVQIDFKPTHNGTIPATGTVGFELDAITGGTTATVGLTGKGLTSTDLISITSTANGTGFVSLIGTPSSTGLTIGSAEEITLPAAAFTVHNGTSSTISGTLALGDTTNFQFVARPSTSTLTPCTETVSLAAGSDCGVWVKFLPESATPVFMETAITLAVTSTDPDVSYQAGIMGKVRQGTLLTIWDPATGTDFGSVPRQLSSAPMGFTVMNIGDAATSGNVTLKIAGTAAATVRSLFTPSGCGTALAAMNLQTPSTAATCAAQVVLSPGNSLIAPIVTGTDTVLLEADAITTNFDGTASGTTATPFTSANTMKGTCINQAALVFNPTGTFTFPGDPQPVDTASSMQIFTVTNGGATTTIPGTPDYQTTSEITLSLKEGAADSTNFVLDLNQGGTPCEMAKNQVTGQLLLRGNQSCTVGVKFLPRAMPATGAAFSATLTATATAGGTATLTLNATGRDDLSVTSPAVAPQAFGTVRVGNEAEIAASEKSIVITNATGAPSTGLLTTKVTGDFFVTSDTCQGVSLDSGETCTVKLRFAPASAAAKTGTLKVSGTPGGTASLELTGTGGA